MEFGACVDKSTAEDPIAECECQMGKVFDKETGTICVDPIITTTPRPIPTMAPNIKAVTSGMQKTSSTLLIVFVAITLVLFAVLRIYDGGRFVSEIITSSEVCVRNCQHNSFFNYPNPHNP